jgi:lipopolysaccharide export system ATP-binding protein
LSTFAALSTRLRAAVQSLAGTVGEARARLTGAAPASHKADDLAESDWRGDAGAEILGASPEDAPAWAQARAAEAGEGYSAGSYLEEPSYDGQGVLSVHNLAKSYKTRRVVEDVSLHVRRGEAVGLLGPNGAGKTTVFYMITGLVKPDRGVISLDGYDVTPLPMYRRARLGIGYLPQEASVFRGLSVEDNIRAVLEITQPDERKRRDELEGLLEEFRLTKMRHTPAVALSGGERRRCEIARALAGHPSFMLLDEPFAGIDPIAVGGIQDLVRHLKARGIGVLITDHSVRETLGLTDRAYIIYNGHVLTEGPPETIVANPDVRRIYLGEDFRM